MAQMLDSKYRAQPWGRDENRSQREIISGRYFSIYFKRICNWFDYKDIQTKYSLGLPRETQFQMSVQHFK